MSPAKLTHDAHHYDVIVAPVITEKATMASEANQVLFKVRKTATKPEIKAAVERVGAGGGKVVSGPTQVPGGSWVIQGQDSQGATFSLVSSKE